jgi:hypothetical protein
MFLYLPEEESTIAENFVVPLILAVSQQAVCL